ncbi:MAG: FtsX-like permease family protein [Cyclobacteriaceae bacterium]
MSVLFVLTSQLAASFDSFCQADQPISASRWYPHLEWEVQASTRTLLQSLFLLHTQKSVLKACHSRPSIRPKLRILDNTRYPHSDLNDFTGFAEPVLIVWRLTVSSEINSNTTAGTTNVSTFLEKLDPDRKEEWGNFGFYTFLLLPDHTHPEALEAKFPAFMEQHIGKRNENGMYYSLFLEPLHRVYLHSDRGGPVTGSLSNIYFFSIIAGFILLIACINFMNLATARATERAKEVGIRKVIGALKRQLTVQFLSESIVLSLFAFVLASIFAELLLPAFNQLSGKIIAESIFCENNNLLLLFLLALGVGILAGIYPAFVLSGFQPVTVLKGRFSSSGRGLLLRKGLVVVQFAISIMLVTGTATVYTQLNYMRSQELGFNKEQMLVINFRRDDKVMQQMEALKNSFKSHPRVLSVAASSSTPSQSNSGAYTNIENPDGEMQSSNIDLYSIDFDFLDQYQIEVVAGRGFSRDFPTDSIQALIINEAAAARYGYASPEDAVGKRFSQWGREGQIIGVIKDFHFRSLQQTIQPLTMRIALNDFKLIPPILMGRIYSRLWLPWNNNGRHWCRNAPLITSF